MRVLITLMLILLSNAALAVPCTYSWTPVTTRTDGSVVDIAEYRLYTSNVPGTYTTFVSIPPTQTSYPMDVAVDTVTYAVLTAVDGSGIESDYSNEVMKNTNKPGPTNLQLQCTITIQ